MVSKKELMVKFSEDWEKHYKIPVLVENGFERRKCEKCGRWFWSVEERKYCGDPACIGYQFIGNPPTKAPLGYVETWKKIEKYFTSHGHESIKPFPTVARWRDDLYFTIASINNFQPYVVKGELEPIANPLIVPQPCIRFNDIGNVGITGRHYTNFVMIGQHAFNTEKTGLFYWKNEALEHDINYLRVLGIPMEEIVFHEDVWVGGGNFGPSMEYFVRGLELGNCVFMQYEVLPDGSYRELKTKVIDMGAGLSRLAWITTGDPTSYEVVFGKAVEYLKTLLPVDLDRDTYINYSKLAGALNVDEGNIKELKEEIRRQLNLTEEFFEGLEKLKAIYSIADHSLTLLFTIRDGMMPSNSGGGYNLRLIARRMFGFMDEFKIDVDWDKLLYFHMGHLKGLFDDYKEAVDVVAEVIEYEFNKYEESKKRARKKIERILSKKEEVKEEDLILLYKSDGIPVELVKELAEEKGKKIEVPPDFYERVRAKDEKKDERKSLVNVEGIPETEKLYYKYSVLEKFEAKVLKVIGSWVVLDKTFFYPEGGGQVGDTGVLVLPSGEEVKVLDTQKEGNVVLHKVERPELVEEGNTVIGKVNLERRWHIIRHHTATHLITAAARKILGKHVWQAGAKKDEEKAHIDLTHYKKITEEELEKIEDLVNQWVLEELPVKVSVIERNKAEAKYGFTIYQGGAVPGKKLRIVIIGDEDNPVDAEACGGTHHMHKNTGSIGLVKIVKRESVKDGVQRLTFKAGLKALEYIREKERLLKNASDVFSVPESELPKTAKRFFEEWKEYRKNYDELSRILIESLLATEGVHVMKLPKAVKPYPASGKGTVVVLSKDKIVVMGKDWEKVKEALVKEGIKGGGKGFFTGELPENWDYERVLNAIKNH